MLGRTRHNSWHPRCCTQTHPAPFCPRPPPILPRFSPFPLILPRFSLVSPTRYSPPPPNSLVSPGGARFRPKGAEEKFCPGRWWPTPPGPSGARNPKDMRATTEQGPIRSNTRQQESAQTSSWAWKGNGRWKRGGQGGGGAVRPRPKAERIRRGLLPDVRIRSSFEEGTLHLWIKGWLSPKGLGGGGGGWWWGGGWGGC